MAVTWEATPLEPLAPLTDGCRELLTLGLPDVGGVAQELLEVVGGAGLVGAVDDLDVGVRKLDALVLGGDGLVVPLGDLALEDLGDVLDGQVQLVDALEVVGDGDRADNERQVPCLVAIATVHGLRGLLIIHRGVGATEGNLTTDEVLTAGAGTGCGVGEGCAVNSLGVLDTEVVHCSLLGGSALTDELAGGAGQALGGGLGGGAGGVGLFGVATGNEGEGADGHGANEGSRTLEDEVHREAFPVLLYIVRATPDCFSGPVPTRGLLME